MTQLALAPNLRTPEEVLSERHYLGPSRRAILTIADDLGVLVFSTPTSRRLPVTWLELVRWCITGGKNAGSMQWAHVVARLRAAYPAATTVVSYSDPSVGHTGALYRACGWLWAPAWHRLRPPPTGNGSWDGESKESVKDRWVYLLAPDAEREGILRVSDDGLRKRMPWASFREPRWRRGAPVPGSGGANWWQWQATRKPETT